MGEKTGRPAKAVASIGLGFVGLAALILGANRMSSPPEPTVPAPQVTADPLPEAVEAPPVILPSVDVVRIEPGGAAVIAGQAEPGAKVGIFADARRIAEAKADADGKFVALFQAEPSTEAQALTLGSEGDTGETAVSDQVVVLLPEDAAPEFAGAAVLSSKGAELMPLARPKGGKVTLSSISYADRGEVSLAGFGAPGSDVRVYVNNVFAEGGTVEADGRWSVALREVAGGVTRLRIDQLAGDGSVANRVETPFQRDFPEPGPGPEAVVVQPGSTLWTLARVHYGAGTLYTQIFKANSDLIRDPNLIYPGQIFRLPEKLAE